jgi:hypothetical protein
MKNHGHVATRQTMRNCMKVCDFWYALTAFWDNDHEQQKYIHFWAELQNLGVAVVGLNQHALIVSDSARLLEF